MIEDEIQDFLDLEQSFNNNKARAIEKLNNEKNEIDNEVKNLRLGQWSLIIVLKQNHNSNKMKLHTFIF